MAHVVLERVCRRFGKLAAVEDMSLEVGEGEFLTLLGPSGCGKTTTLRMIAGFLAPSSGRIFFDGEDVTAFAPRRRHIGMVFQDYALFPHMTVAENVAFGLRERRWRPAAIAARVSELLGLIRLPGIEHRYPGELSGGQQQRVALARALAYAPRLLLMDEPLGALDLKLRETMQIELHQVQRQLKITTIYVTHDQEEAMSLSDRIAVMSDGRLVQVGPPEDVYTRPHTPFVASFVGKTNFLDGTVLAVTDRECTIDMGGRHVVRAIPPTTMTVGQRVRVALRPEHLVVTREAEDPGGAALPGKVERRQFLGNRSQYFVRMATDHLLLVETPGERELLTAGEAVTVRWEHDAARVFDRE